MTAQFNGLTWDHPRGYDALAEAARRVNSGQSTPLIHWEKQPLEGFESAPIAELAARHDLLVLDHPHLGEAIATDCLIPLDELYPKEQLEHWASHCIGNAFESYQMAGKSWALPLDVATQVMVRRADRIAQAPADWQAIARLAEKEPVALSLAGPHAILTLMSIAAGKGILPGGPEFLDDDTMRSGLELMQSLYSRRPAGSEKLNPIALLDSMSHRNDIALVPLIFGYVTYAIPGRYPCQLAFSDSIGLSDEARTEAGHPAVEPRGGVLGGTGIGFSRRASPTPALLEHIAQLLSEQYQRQLFPQFGGQPSLRSAWQDDDINTGTGDFYRNCLNTAENPLLRPRFDGYIAFQSAAAQCVREALSGTRTIARSIEQIRRQWQLARSSCRGDTDDRYR